eukprot:TRINITY_DN4559_c0_g1_i1.p1 TRINITY_DN4559_c0_g1~~TRINITY_DN4559_c0_g1_i1.p1  ORF type:complete len:112 (+),score=22.45 TRINITY_DN4559_c0_g1_i1:402-737(+)
MMAICFRPSSTVIISNGENHISNLYVFCQTRIMPALWSQPQIDVRYANIVAKNIVRGRYTQEGDKMLIQITQQGQSRDDFPQRMALISSDCLHLFMELNGFSFEPFTFHKW